MDLKDRIETHRDLISDRLDPDFELLDELLSRRSLTRSEVAKVKAVSDSYGRSVKLLEYVCDKGIYEKFLDALRNTQQTHLVNFISSNGERLTEFGDDWPLTEREMLILDSNQRTLVDLLDTNDLIPCLYSHKLISNRQRDFVSSKAASHEKNDVLLEILRRSSLQNYKKTIYCLHLSKQSHVADVLKEGGGFVRVRSELETASDVNEVEDELITKITEMLGDHSLGDSARILECTQLRLIAVKKGNSIILYFFCKTSTEVISLQEMQASGKLDIVIRKMFNEILSRQQVINLRTTLYDEDVSRCESWFSRHVVGKEELDERCNEIDGSTTSNTAMHNLPLELVDVILGKVYGLSGVFASQSDQPTDEEIVRNIASVDYCWFQRVRQRRFKNIIWRNLKEFYRKCCKRIIICRNTRSYLMEKIQTKGLLNRLRSMDCLTDIEKRLVNRGKERSRQITWNKEELLHLVKSIDDSRYSSFVQCLRDSKQTTCAKVATHGGVVVKAELQCSKLKNRKSAEQEMMTALSNIRDKTKPKTAPLNRQINRLKSESIEIIDSFLDRIPIVWLWCHSQIGLDKLRIDSSLIFNLVNLATIARFSLINKVTAVNIDCDRLKREVVISPTADLKFSRRLSIKEDVRVRGLTQLHNNVYVLCRSYSPSPNSIQVYTNLLPLFPLLCKITIDDITEPEDIGSNEAERCLYVTDSAADKCIWKMDATDHRLTRWLTGVSAEPFTLSVSSDGQLLMVSNSHPVSSLVIYGPGGDLRCTYPLPLDIRNPQHAVETTSGTFMILHELKQERVDVTEPRRQLWTVSEVTRDDQMTIRRFVSEGSDQMLDRPTYLALDSDEQVFIADTWAERVVHLDSDLTWKRVLLKRRDALWSLRVHYDALNHRLMVGGLAAVDIYAAKKS